MEKIWLKSYEKGVPSEVNPDAYSSLLEVFFQSCEHYKNRPALSNLGTQITYGEWYQKSRDFAAYLQKTLGVKKGDRFAIMLPNLLQYPIAFFGALMAGMTVVNVNPLYTVPELVHQINDAQADVLLVLSNFARTVDQALPQMAVRHIIVTDVGDLYPFPKSWIVNFAVKYIKKMVPKWRIPQAISFNTALKIGKSLSWDEVSLKGEDIAVLQYTGGTTGIAKGAMLTHRNLVANIEQAYAWVSSQLKPGKEIVITALPLYHIFSLTANCLLFMKIGAMSILITNPRDIPGFIHQIRKIPFTAITGVNTLFNALLNNPKFAELDFKSKPLVLGGGMAVHRSVAERWKKVTGSPLLEAYGLTEASPAVSINPLNLEEFNGSIGLPFPSTEISIRNANDEEVPIGEAGELWIRGPQVMKGYWNNAAETRNTITPEGWLKSGDIATMDEKGFLFLVDRKKDMILVSGFNVYPNEIEDVIASHPGVLEVGVRSVPADIEGEAVKAFIVRKDPQLTEKEIIDYCRKRLAGYKIPKQIAFRTELPKSNVGKILRRALK